MKRPAKVHAVLRHQQHLLLVALYGLAANPGISMAAARSLRQGIGVPMSGPGQESSPAEEEEAEEALADEDAAPSTNMHDLAFVSQQRDLATQPPTPSPVSVPPLSPAPILAPPPFASPPPPPFPAPGPSPMVLWAPVPSPAMAPAPAMAVSPATAPAPVMAPAPVEMQSPYGPDVPVVQVEESTATTTTIEETTTTSGAQDFHVLKVSHRFKNIDYNALTADKALLDDFKETVREDIAEKAGHGVTPDDVEITIRPGSVIVDATVTVQEDVSAQELNNTQQKTCSSVNDIAKDVAGIDGISSVASGTVQGEVRGSCVVGNFSQAKPVIKAKNISATKKNNSAAAETDDDDMDACHPACVPGQGLCSDKMCFCKSPYMGMRCERLRKSASIRISYPLSAGIAAFGLFLGTVVGFVFFQTIGAKKLKGNTAVPEKKAEKWEAFNEK